MSLFPIKGYDNDNEDEDFNINLWKNIGKSFAEIKKET